MLEFRDALPPKECRSITSMPIRRRSVGGDFFLVTDEKNLPVRLELVGGEAFPKSAYADELALVEDMVRSTPWTDWHQGLSSAPFLRVVDAEDYVAFLAATTVDLAELAKENAVEFADGRAAMSLRSHDGEDLLEGIVYRRS
jgi:hypothetical protein